MTTGVNVSHADVDSVGKQVVDTCGGGVVVTRDDIKTMVSSTPETLEYSEKRI